VDPRQLRVINDFSAFPASAAGTITSELPCAGTMASDALGYKASVDTSPCVIPEITAMYAEALQDAGYANDAKLIKVRANVIDTSLTSMAWCKGDAWIGSTGESCFCSSGASGCSGSGCVQSGDFSWYDQACTKCTCDGGGTFTQAIFEQSIPLLNARKDIPFLNFSAAAYRSWQISQADYNTIFGDGLDVLSDSEVELLFQLFNSSYDAVTPGDSASPHNMSEYLEMFVIPGFKGGDTAGFAHSRGHEVSTENGTVVIPPAIYLSESSATTVSAAVPLIGHELGHTLGLLHTFSGLKLTSLQNETCKQCTPTVANAATTGDFITDTPPTSSLHAGSGYPAPLASSTVTCTISFNSSGFCTELPGGTGNMRNIMTYGSDDCQATFTPQQQARMRCHMDQDFGVTHIADLGPGLVLLSATYVASDFKIQLAWLPPVSEVWCSTPLCSLTSYRISRLSGSTWEVIGSTNGIKRDFDDLNISAGCTYQYKVAAVKGANVGAAVAKSVTTPGNTCGTPLMPTTTTATATATSTTMQSTGDDHGSAQETVAIQMTVQGVSYNALQANTTLRNLFETSIKETVAEEAGHGLVANDVSVEMSAGSVVVVATIDSLPTSVSASSLRNTMAGSTTLSSAVVSAVSGVSGIDQATSGSITVTGMTVSVKDAPQDVSRTSFGSGHAANAIALAGFATLLLGSV